jgi:hypothetical protein
MNKRFIFYLYKFLYFHKVCFKQLEKSCEVKKMNDLCSFKIVSEVILHWFDRIAVLVII